MTRGSSNRSAKTYEPNAHAISRDLILVTVLLVVILIIVWLLSRVNLQTDRGAGSTLLFVVGIGLTVCLLTVQIELMLSIFNVSLKRRYRVSFLCSCATGWIFLLIWSLADKDKSWPSSEVKWIIFLLVCIPIFAYLGGLIVTVYREGFVENNYPPSEEVARQVHDQHFKWIGSPKVTPISKRSFDILMSSIGLCISSPVWLLSGLLIWLEDPGPLLFVKNSVGKGGINFRQYKFRTMIRGAEESTGPVLSSYGDQRVLFTGKLLRKTALDELPQLVNILKGEMSFVGPRPQRTIMVNEYLKVMPEYAGRHLVLPGLAGLAQVVGHYYLTPRQKLRFDRIYIQHANLGFDLLLILLAFVITFGYRWKKDWNGRLPRRLLHPKPRG